MFLRASTPSVIELRRRSSGGRSGHSPKRILGDDVPVPIVLETERGVELPPPLGRGLRVEFGESSGAEPAPHDASDDSDVPSERPGESVGADETDGASSDSDDFTVRGVLEGDAAPKPIPTLVGLGDAPAALQLSRIDGGAGDGSRRAEATDMMVVGPVRLRGECVGPTR